MDSYSEKLIFNTDRRFGVEIEVNSSDGKNRPFNDSFKTVLPQGMDYVGNAVSQLFGEPTYLSKWGYKWTNNNLNWVLKPDTSCGMEICSPVSKGSYGINRLCRLVEMLRDDPKITIDDRCSFHVHVEVADCSDMQLASILAHWIKCELVFIDSVPSSRKRNRYAQLIAVSDLLEHDTSCTPEKLIGLLGRHKYNTINTYHMNKGRRSTIEFRIAENTACCDPFLLKNWIKLLLHFVDMAKERFPPREYKEGDRWSSFLLLDPIDVFEVLGFLDGELSDGLKQTRNWFLGRLHANVNSFGDIPEESFWSRRTRTVSAQQIQTLYKKFQIKPEDLNPLDLEYQVYSERFRF